MNNPAQEQRCAKRKDVFSPVRFQYKNMREPENGLLANISSSGLMLWTTRDFCPDGKLTVWLQTSHSRFPPIQVSARVVRTELTHNSEFAFGFGCQIIDESVDDLMTDNA